MSPVPYASTIKSLNLFKRLEETLKHRQRKMTRRFLREESIDLEKFCRDIANRLGAKGLGYLQCMNLIVTAYNKHTVWEETYDKPQANRRRKCLRKIADNLVSDRNPSETITVDEVVVALLTAIGGRQYCDDSDFLWKCGKLLEQWEKLDSQLVPAYGTRQGRIRQ
jgi:hypothetical protein